jgi:AcrR family transcriptional regulator
MSGNEEAQVRPATPGPFSRVSTRPDRRILRTRNALGDALIQLMQELPFDAITVQRVLDRADVSRATFYAHFRDKDDLLLSDVEDFLDTLGTLLTRRGAPPTRLAPVEELFAHIADVPGLHAAIQASGKGADIRELGTGCFARSIEKRLVAAGVTLPIAELRGTAHALAGALLSLLDWWPRLDNRLPPKEVDVLFHRLAWSGIPPAARPAARATSRSGNFTDQ